MMLDAPSDAGIADGDQLAATRRAHCVWSDVLR